MSSINFEETSLFVVWTRDGGQKVHLIESLSYHKAWCYSGYVWATPNDVHAQEPCINDITKVEPFEFEKHIHLFSLEDQEFIIKELV